jgi:hypothetical protein
MDTRDPLPTEGQHGENRDPTLVLPPPLTKLLAAGKWPRTNEEAHRQMCTPRVRGDDVARLVPTERFIYLNPPPFKSLVSLSLTNSFWNRHGVPDELDFGSALLIADFEIGSDSGLVLDYGSNRSDPQVKYLQWTDSGNHWVQVAESFEALARALGLLDDVA